MASAQQDSTPALLESYGGASIVSWYDSIDRQIDGMVGKYEERHMHDIADRLRTFLTTWKGHEITGSVNREDIEPLKTATEQLASDNWKLKVYFQNLRGQLRTLEASLEELPTTAFPTPEPAQFPTTPPAAYGPRDQTPPGAGGPSPAGGPPGPAAPTPPPP